MEYAVHVSNPATTNEAGCGKVTLIPYILDSGQGYHRLAAYNDQAGHRQPFLSSLSLTSPVEHVFASREGTKHHLARCKSLFRGNAS